MREGDAVELRPAPTREPSDRATKMGQALVEATDGGVIDQDAFERAYEEMSRYIGPTVRASVRRDAMRNPAIMRVVSEDDYPDLIQQVFLKIAREVGKGRFSRDPRFAADRSKSWIMSEVWKQHRARQRKKRLAPVDSYEESKHAVSIDPLRGSEEAQIDLRMIVERLRWPNRYVLGLWILCDGDMGLVAQTMGLSGEKARELFREALDAARGRPSFRPGHCLGRSILIHGVAHVAMPVGAETWFTDRSKVTVGRPVRERGVALVQHVPSTLIVASGDHTTLVPIVSASRRPGKGARGGSLLRDLPPGTDVHVVGCPGNINIWW